MQQDRISDAIWPGEAAQGSAQDDAELEVEVSTLDGEVGVPACGFDTAPSPEPLSPARHRSRSEDEAAFAASLHGPPSPPGRSSSSDESPPAPRPTPVPSGGVSPPRPPSAGGGLGLLRRRLSAAATGLGDALARTAASAGELLSDARLRRQGGAVLAEGASRGLRGVGSGISKGVRRGVAGLSAGPRQLRATLARVVARAEEERRRAAQREQGEALVDVQCGPVLYEDAPQELRSRLWIAVLERPELVVQFRGLCRAAEEAAREEQGGGLGAGGEAEEGEDGKGEMEEGEVEEGEAKEAKREEAKEEDAAEGEEEEGEDEKREKFARCSQDGKEVELGRDFAASLPPSASTLPDPGQTLGDSPASPEPFPPRLWPHSESENSERPGDEGWEDVGRHRPQPGQGRQLLEEARRVSRLLSAHPELAARRAAYRNDLMSAMALVAWPAVGAEEAEEGWKDSAQSLGKRPDTRAGAGKEGGEEEGAGDEGREEGDAEKGEEKEEGMDGFKGVEEEEKDKKRILAQDEPSRLDASTLLVSQEQRAGDSTATAVLPDTPSVPLPLSAPSSRRSPSPLSLQPDAAARYATLLQISVGQEEVDDVISRDVHRTFPEYALFCGAAGQRALFRVLKAYSLHDLEVGYCQGMAFVVGALLLAVPEEAAFALLCSLLSPEGPDLRRLYLPGLAGLKRGLAALDAAMSLRLPRLRAHLAAHGVVPVLYASQWLLTAFACPFPLPFAWRLLDAMLLSRSDRPLVAAAVAVLAECEADLLLRSDFEDILTYLKIEPLSWGAGSARARRALDAALSAPWVFLPHEADVLCGMGRSGLESVDLKADEKKERGRESKGETEGGTVAREDDPAANLAAPDADAAAPPPRLGPWRVARLKDGAPSPVGEALAKLAKLAQGLGPGPLQAGQNPSSEAEPSREQRREDEAQILCEVEAAQAADESQVMEMVLELDRLW